MSTDGANSMKGHGIGLAGRMTRHLSSLGVEKQLLTIHCLVHQEALCAKSVDIPRVMSVVTKVINFIRARANGEI